MVPLCRIPAFCVLAALSVATLTASSSDAAVTLRLKHKQGETNRIQIEQEMNSNARVQGQEIRNSMKQTMVTETHIESVNSEGTAKARQEIKQVRMSMSMPAPVNQEFSFDSEKAENPSAPPGYSDVMGALIGKPFTMNISPTGKLSDIQVPAGVLEQMQKIPGAAMMQSMTSEEGLRQMMTQSAFHLPEKPVDQGDTWSNDVTMDMPFGKLIAKQVYTYQGTNAQGLHEIGITVEMQIEPAEDQPFKMSLKNSDSSGTMLFDNDAGEVKSVEMKQNMDMQMSVADQTFDQSIEQVIRLKSLD